MQPLPCLVSRFAAELEGIGLRGGDLVMVHASLRAIGPVAGGAHGVIEAIRLAIGAGGTMLMVLGSRDDHAWVNQRPEPLRSALLADAEPFDARTTPADPGVGRLAEVFRRRPETLVSDHPEGRFAAAGPAAGALLADVPWDDYFGPRSPLERLVEGGGSILRLGADPDTVTALHYAEYRCTVSPKRRVRRHRLVSTPDGPRVRVVASLDDEHGIVDYPAGDYFAHILEAYLECGRARRGRVGRAASELIDAADIVAFGARWMDAHLRMGPQAEPARELRARLEADLLRARRRGHGPEVAAIRSLKSALANAEAVPLEDDRYRVVEGPAEVPRRTLTAPEVATVVAAELDERAHAIEELRRHGLDTAALEEELATLGRYRLP